MTEDERWSCAPTTKIGAAGRENVAACHLVVLMLFVGTLLVMQFNVVEDDGPAGA